MKRLIYIGIALATIGLLALWFVFNKPHENHAKAEASVACSAEEFSALVESGQVAAEHIVLITGTLADVQPSGISTLQPNLSIKMDSTFSAWDQLKAGNQATIKARYLGYNDLFEEYEFDHGVVPENN